MNILITGGSSGLGKAIVYALSSLTQNKIFFTYNKHSNDADVLVRERHNTIALKCDFTNTDEIRELEAAIPTFDLDVLINNAYVGTPQGKHFHKTDSASFLKMFENNLIPTIRITQQALSGFRKKKYGKIINILTAYLVNVPPTGLCIYTANKAYLQQLSKSWSNEYAQYNISSNCISPEFMFTNLAPDLDERIIEQIQDRHPMKKLLTPAEVADTVVYLVNASQQVNGAHIVINAAQNIL